MTTEWEDDKPDQILSSLEKFTVLIKGCPDDRMLSLI